MLCLNYIKMYSSLSCAKKNKKRFFVNNKKYFLHLALVSLFPAYHNCMAQEQSTTQPLQESTQAIQKDQTITTTPKKKHGIINKIIKTPRCPYGSIPVRKMSIDQLKEVYDYTQKYKVDLNLLTSVLERLISLSDDHVSVKTYKLQYADAQFQMKHIELAATLYEDFATLYPSSKESIYTLFKAVLCMFEISLDADRDQTNTKKTIALANEFIKQNPTSEYVPEAQTILTTCHNRLYDHEVYVFNFYMKKKNYTSAQMRLDFMSKIFEKLIPDLDKKIDELKKQLESAKNPIPVKKKTSINKYL